MSAHLKVRGFGNGAARRTAAKVSSTVHWSIETITTICCTRTSRDFREYLVLDLGVVHRTHDGRAGDKVGPETGRR